MSTYWIRFRSEVFFVLALRPPKRCSQRPSKAAHAPPSAPSRHMPPPPGYKYRGDTDPLSRLEGIELTQRLHGLRRGTKGAPVPCGVLNAGALRSLRPPPRLRLHPPPRPKTPPPPPPPPPNEYTLRNLMRRTHMKNSDYFKMWDVDDSDTSHAPSLSRAYAPWA